MSEIVDQEESAIGWISFADLFMVGGICFLLLMLKQAAVHRTAESDAQLADRLEKTTAAVLELQTKLDLANAMAQDADRKLNKMGQQKQAFEESYSEAEQRVKARDVQLTEAQIEILKQEDLIAMLRQQLDTLRSQLLKSQQLLKELRELMGTAATADQIAAWKLLEKEVAELRAQMAALQQMLADCQQQMQQIQRERDSLLAKNAALEAENKRLSQREEYTVERERGFRQELLGIHARKGRFGRVVFVVDRSGSMVRSSNTGQKSRWDSVRDVIESWLLLLPFEEVQLILFNNEVEVFPRDGGFLELSGSDETRQQTTQPLLDVLRETTPDQGTNTKLALLTAYQSQQVDAIFLFTDGQPMLKSEQQTTTDDIRELQYEVLDLIAARQKDGDAPPINVIGLGDYFNDRLAGANQRHMPFGVFLTTIAQRTGGSFLGR